ncbi:MAG: hypothetical protein ABJN22_08190 [Litorimonas sp.]
MRDLVQNLKIILIAGASCIAVTACAPSYQMSTDAYSMQGSQTYGQTAYGYEMAQTTTYNSRYGGELRGSSCDVVVQSCGMMAVIPVYPVFQVTTAPYEPEVKIVEVEVPVEVPVYIEPEPPVIEPPVHHWPDPETPVIPWTPPRK